MKKLECRRRDGLLIANEVNLADSFISRLLGLMFKEIEHAKALVVKPTQSIHTCFMKFNIDVVFLNRENKIVKIIRNMKPWRVTGFYFSASQVLELPAGKLPLDVQVGQELEFNNV